MKHIESILPEHAAGEISRMLAGDDATATAALTTLLHNATGCDIPETSDLPASEVEELVPLCVSILRRHWKTPLTCLGDGSTPMSLADLLRQTIGDRVQGNEAWSIPAANANIPTTVAALRQRDMSSGLTLTLEDGGADGSTDGSTTSPTTMPLPDGLSLAQLLCSGLADKVTEIVDNNRGWVADKTGWLSRILNLLPNITKATFGCTSMTASPMNVNTSVAAEIHIKTKDLNFSQESVENNMSNCDVWLDELETCNVRAQGAPTFRAKRIFFPIFRHGTYSVGGSAGWQNKQTQYIYFGCYGKRTESIILTNYAGGSSGSTHSLAILEIRQGARQRIEFANIPSWDCYPNMTAANIVAYIFDKLADNNYEDDGITEAPAITIKLGSHLLAKLSAEQIAVATDKNYTVTA